MTEKGRTDRHVEGADAPRKGMSAVLAGVGMPGETGVDARGAPGKVGMAVLVHPSVDLSNLQQVWRGYGVLAVRAASREDAAPASTRRVAAPARGAGRAHAETMDEWDVVSRVRIEIDPKNPRMARWERCNDVQPFTLSSTLKEARDAYLTWKDLDRLPPEIANRSNTVVANLLVSAALADEPRQYAMALAEDDLSARLRHATGVMARAVAQNTELEAWARVAHLPMTPAARNEIAKISRRAIEALEIESYDEAAKWDRILETVAALPWGEPARPPTMTSAAARAVLDESHFGLPRPKVELLRLLSDQTWWGRKMETLGEPNLPSPPLPVICLVGTYGNGKTTLVEALATAMGREYRRIPVGSITEASILKGHDSTFLGAKAGRVLNEVASAGTTNLVLLLDEIDKIGGGPNSGQVQAALMELLDPSQRSQWVDNMLGQIPVDLSNVLIVCTANDAGDIPSSLRSRMKMLEVPGYSSREKLDAARSHLIPRARTKHLLTADEFDISDKALAYVIKEYTEEGGLRKLNERIGELARGTQEWLLEGNEPRVVDIPRVVEILDQLDIRLDLPPAVGPSGYFRTLAVGDAGGVVLADQVTFRKAPANRGGKVIFTGMIGKMSRETATLVQTMLTTVIPPLWEERFGTEFPHEFMETHDLHYSVERWEGSDGPSAGVITLMGAISALTGIPMRGDVLCTGTVTARGAAQAVGGVDLKLLAAHDLMTEQGIKLKKVLIPSECVGYLRKLPADVLDPARGGLEVIPISRIEEAFDIFFSPEIVQAYRKTAGPDGIGPKRAVRPGTPRSDSMRDFSPPLKGARVPRGGAPDPALN